MQSHIAQLKHKLKLMELYETNGAQIKAQLNWLKIGDKVTKEFF